MKRRLVFCSLERSLYILVVSCCVRIQPSC